LGSTDRIASRWYDRVRTPIQGAAVMQLDSAALVLIGWRADLEVRNGDLAEPLLTLRRGRRRGGIYFGEPFHYASWLVLWTGRWGTDSRPEVHPTIYGVRRPMTASVHPSEWPVVRAPGLATSLVEQDWVGLFESRDGPLRQSPPVGHVGVLEAPRVLTVGEIQSFRERAAR
jgi:hypothetical protein